MAVRSGKIRSSTKTFAKNRRRPKPSAAIHRPPRGPPQNPVWFSTIFTPLRDFHFFEGDPNFVENSQRFWKESPESSKTSETTLEFCTRVPKQRAPNLHTCKTCQTCQLRKTCKTCVAGLHTVCNRLQQCRYKGGVRAANAAPRGRTSSYIL